MRIALYVLVFAALASGVAACAYAYPDKPIRLLLPYPPGAGSDVIARLLAQKLADHVGQQVIVDNRGGAGGNIGMELAAKAPADGYTLVLALTSQLAINPGLYPKLPYDPVKDYAPITLLGSAPYLLVIHPALPATSVRELIALAKSRRGGLTFASAGNGSGAHLAAELLKSMAGIDMLHVPYKGAGPALPDLIAGQVQLMFATYSASGQHVRAARLRALAVTTAKRSSALPDLPTIAESGVAGYDSSVWYGLLAPAKTPAPIIARLNGELIRVLNAPDVRDRIRPEAIEPIGSTPEFFAGYIRSELAKWAQVVKGSGAKID
jgi:tripartite-type tricarboxylate transporter receptor subunit TctC